jgi:SAM-dependent methyltransferase
MAKEFADSAPPPTVAIAAAATASGAPGYELIAVAPTKLWRLYRVLYLLHDRILVTVLPVWCFIMLTLWSSVALWRTRASDPVVFAVFVLCVSIIGASLVVSLVEYSQPRYSYPMDWALFMTVPLLVLMWKKTQPVSQPAMTTNATLKTGSQTYSSAIETAVNYTRWIISRCVPFIGRSIMEVGLGHGGYRRFLPQSARYLGLDIDHESVTQAKNRHPEDAFLVADVTDPTLRSHLHGRGIDTILCINVLEHIAEDRKAIENLMAVLEPGGHLVVLSPAFPVLYSSLDEMAGHVRRYTKADLPRLVPPGMTLVRSEYFNAIGGIGWFVNKLFRHDDLNSTAVNSQIVVFDRFLVPISRAVDVMCRPVFGQSILFAIRKP